MDDAMDRLDAHMDRQYAALDDAPEPTETVKSTYDATQDHREF